jgi:flagellar biogenesis protein FliO
MEIGEFLIRFLGSFLFAIAILYAIFFYLKRNPAAMQLVKKGPKDPSVLSVETMMVLEPRKNLYIVKAGHERILISTSAEGTQFLSKLEPAMETASAQQGLETRHIDSNQTNLSTTSLEASSQVQHMTFTPAVKALFALWDGLRNVLKNVREKLGKPSERPELKSG